MFREMMEHYGLVREFRNARYYETAHQKQMFKNIKAAIYSGKLVALVGIVGCGKTAILRQLQEVLEEKEGKVLVSKSLSLDKDRATLRTRIPLQGDKCEQKLCDLIKKGKKPVVLLVDDAHDLCGSTLTGLKRLIEVVKNGGGTLSVVLARHPKLENNLCCPTLEEMSNQVAVFSLESIFDARREYIEWLLNECTDEDTQVNDVLEAEAIDMLANYLLTPLQIERHLTLVFEAAYQVGEKPITAMVVESVLSKHMGEALAAIQRHEFLTIKFLQRLHECCNFLATRESVAVVGLFGWLDVQPLGVTSVLWVRFLSEYTLVRKSHSRQAVRENLT